MTRRPCRSVSSPVFTTTVRSPAGSTDCSPWASFAPPVPPARATTFIRWSRVEELADLGHAVDGLAVVRTRHPDDEGLEAELDVRMQSVGHLGRGPEEDRSSHVLDAVVRQLHPLGSLGGRPRVAQDDGVAQGLLDRRDVAPDVGAMPGEDLEVTSYLLDGPAPVPRIGPQRHGPQRLLGAGPTDQDRQ